MFKKIIASSFLLASLLTIQPALADKGLNNMYSTISFVSIKKGTAGEAHTFRKMEGSLTEKGELMLTVDLSSVDTKIAIRDERMQKTLFNTDNFPKMTLTANVDANLAVGEMKHITTEAVLDLHGIKEKIKVEALVTNMGNKLLAVSKEPVIISAATFGLEEGVKKLQELAKLPSIAMAVPVSFTLVFE